MGKTIGAVEEISEEEAEDRLQYAIQENCGVFRDKDHQAIDIHLAREKGRKNTILLLMWNQKKI